MKQKQSTTKQDDFRQIKGIGPVTAGRLHEAEIHTYGQLTAVSPQALAELLPGITAERIQQEDWHGQAEALNPASSAANGDGQHYATFTVELLLDKDNTVRRTRIVHVQQEENKKSWSGWQPKEIKSFIAHHAQLVKKQSVAAKPDETPATAVPAPTSPQRSKAAAHAAPTHALHEGSIDELTMRFLQPAQADVPETAEKPNPQHSGKETAVEPQLTPHPLSVELNTPNILLEHGHAFNVQLYLDLERLAHDWQTPLNYQAAIYAARLGSNARQKVGTTYGNINTAAKKVAINVPTRIGTPGTYRLEAEMAIAWIPATPDITASSKGGLLHIC